GWKLDQSLWRRRPSRKDELVDAGGPSHRGVRLLDGFSIRGESRTTPALKVVCQLLEAGRARRACRTRRHGAGRKGCVRRKDGDGSSGSVGLLTLDNGHVQRGPRLRDGVRAGQRDQHGQQQQQALSHREPSMGQRLGFTQESLLRPLPGGPRAPPLGSSRSTIVGCARDPLDPRGELASGRAPADEGDAAISVASPDENPTRDANARPCWRAATISLSTLIGTTVFSAKAWAPPSIAANGSLRSGLFSVFSVLVCETLVTF